MSPPLSFSDGCVTGDWLDCRGGWAAFRLVRDAGDGDFRMWSVRAARQQTASCSSLGRYGLSFITGMFSQFLPETPP